MSPHVPASTPATVPAVRPALVLLGVLALAVNLRAALAAYPPLLETVRDDLGISSGAAGLVQAGAVLMMAAGSFVGPALGAPFGRKPALGGAVGLVASAAPSAAGPCCRRWSAAASCVGLGHRRGGGAAHRGRQEPSRRPRGRGHRRVRGGDDGRRDGVQRRRGAARRRSRRLVVLPRGVDGAGGARGRGLDADRASHRPRRTAREPRTGLPWRTGLRPAGGLLPGRDVADVLRLADVAGAVLRGPRLASGPGRSAARGVERRPDPRGAARPGDGRAAPAMAVLGGPDARLRAGRHARRAARAPAPGRRPVAVGRAHGDRRRRRLPARADRHRLAHPGRQRRAPPRAGSRSASATPSPGSARWSWAC